MTSYGSGLTLGLRDPSAYPSDVGNMEHDCYMDGRIFDPKSVQPILLDETRTGVMTEQYCCVPKKMFYFYSDTTTLYVLAVDYL